MYDSNGKLIKKIAAAAAKESKNILHINISNTWKVR